MLHVQCTSSWDRLCLPPSNILKTSRNSPPSLTMLSTDSLLCDSFNAFRSFFKPYKINKIDVHSMYMLMYLKYTVYHTGMQSPFLRFQSLQYPVLRQRLIPQNLLENERERNLSLHTVTVQLLNPVYIHVWHNYQTQA